MNHVINELTTSMASYPYTCDTIQNDLSASFNSTHLIIWRACQWLSWIRISGFCVTWSTFSREISMCDFNTRIVFTIIRWEHKPADMISTCVVLLPGAWFGIKDGLCVRRTVAHFLSSAYRGPYGCNKEYNRKYLRDPHGENRCYMDHFVKSRTAPPLVVLVK